MRSQTKRRTEALMRASRREDDDMVVDEAEDVDEVSSSDSEPIADNDSVRSASNAENNTKGDDDPEEIIEERSINSDMSEIEIREEKENVF